MPAEGTGLPAIGEEIAGKYRVESVLGQGGMGAVYAARNKLTGKRVAIKWLLPEHAASVTRERLLREAQIASSIDHPNVVDIYDVGEHHGGLFLVMEYLRGRPLSDVLAERGRLDPPEMAALLVPAMRGVHAAHQAGVIHRDLKPDNIILSESDGQIVPKVLDFGVSKTVGAASVPASSLTRTGALVGTPHYMALEQVDGSNAIEIRTDVYAFGVLMYRSLTGHFPFDGSTLGEVILKIGTKEPVPMRMLRPELPPGLDHVVLRALSRDRNKRFKDVDEFARALQAHASPVSAQTSPSGISFRALGIRGISESGSIDSASLVQTAAAADGRSRRRRAAMLGAAVAALVLIATALLMREEAEPSAAAQSENSNTGVAVGAPALEAPAPSKPVVVVPEPQPEVTALVRDPGSSGEAIAQPPSAPSDEPSAPPVEPVEAKSASRNLAPAAKAAKNVKHVREPAPVRKSGPALIPGDRTNGLSSDDF